MVTGNDRLRARHCFQGVSLRGSLAGDVHMDAIFMTNFDTKRSTRFDAPSPPRSPEVPPGLAPSPKTAAPLDPSLKSYHSEPLHSGHAAPHPLAISNIAADDMDQAYDGLHRTQGMLAYLEMMKQENLAIGQYLDEAKHTYLQALSRYQGRDLEGACEFAAASISLSRLVEILISRSFDSNSDYPKIAPPPPEHVSGVTSHGAQIRRARRARDSQLVGQAGTASRRNWCHKGICRSN